MKKRLQGVINESVDTYYRRTVAKSGKTLSRAYEEALVIWAYLDPVEKETLYQQALVAAMGVE